MLDTMTFTKVIGGVCGTLLVFLLGKWVAETLYHTEAGGHGDEHIAGYVIETGGDDDGAAAEEEVIDLATLLASADAGKGEKTFKKCGACHSANAGENKTGPYLAGIVGRATGGAEGFGNYSGALSEATDAWTEQALFDFLENPKAYAPGNSMNFKGVAKPQDRANLIAYLNGL